MGIKEEFGLRKCIKMVGGKIVNRMVEGFVSVNEGELVVRWGNGGWGKI